MRHVLRGLRLGTAALCLVCTLTLPTPATAQEVGVAARVNGADISVFRLERHFEDYLKLQARNVAAIRNPEVFKRLKRDALDQLIDKELLWQESQRRGVKIDDAAVEHARKGIEAGFATRDAYERRVRDAGFNEATYAEYLRHELAASRTLQDLAGMPEVSDDEVRRTLEREPAPEGMPEAEAKRQVREYLVVSRRAEAGHSALQKLRSGAKVDVMQKF
ncbi:SurA N-terminal domain-containing protein [Aromatoleum toluclasticum]|uniref:SurA N-terminal domain-containing protein n=1 Tax=Aromatoleum toluclasticum TaxID=92003 RepID=UPI001D18A3B3|nr:SurA N-terminal domain-containing protein [Aromatoleum toluclasticum]MCC4114361.1 SurA N-terminal domain-containing protein [Aromatoleum toluclasticum]